MFFSKGYETMVVVVSADRVDSNAALGELGADGCHEAHCLETGVDIESDHLAWEGILNAIRNSRFLRGDYCGSLRFSEGHLDLKSWWWRLQTGQRDEYEGVGA